MLLKFDEADYDGDGNNDNNGDDKMLKEARK
jgi:hypothetical protein